MIPAVRAYLSGAMAVTASTGMSLAGGFVSLFFLARVLTKEELGGYAFAFNVLVLCTLVATWGLERTIMLRVARFAPDPENMRGRPLMMRAVACTVGASLVIGLLLVTATPWIVTQGVVPTAAFWLPALAFGLIPMTVSSVLQAWYRANSRVVLASLTHGAVNALRAVFLAVVVVSGGGPVSIAIAVIFSMCAPVVILWWFGRKARNRPPAYLEKKDLSDGAAAVVQKVSNYGMRILDVILVGALATGAETAEYTVAARLALFCGLGADVLLPTYTPRRRRFFVSGDVDVADQEHSLARAASFIVSMAVAICLVVAGDMLLGVFGDFGEAYGPLLILCASYMIAAGAGLHLPYMHMRGEIFGTTLINLAALGVLIAFSFLLIPRAGATGGALASSIAVLFLHSTALVYMRLRTGFSGVTVASVASALSAAGVLIYTGLFDLNSFVAAALLAAILGLVMVFDAGSRQVVCFLGRRFGLRD